MDVLRDFEDWPSGPLHLALGVFDGVHAGHRALIDDLARGAARAGATPLAATFDPLPIEVLAPGAPPSALSDIDERCVLLRAAGAGAVVVFAFTRAFASLTPEEFSGRVAAAGAVRRVLVGADFQFGRERSGDVRTLAALGMRLGFTVDIAPAVTMDGEVVSSTRIRNMLLAGDVTGAARLLGRPYGVSGVVEHGEARGRALGYPTMNVAVPAHRLLPRDGIYAMWAQLRSERVRAAASLGVRPTFGGGERRLEAHLLDWNGDAYGDRVRLEFIRRLRDELRFHGAADLSAQIAKDVEEARAALEPPARPPEV